MTEKEISKLTRKELIKMLISLTEENDSLREENEKLAKELKTRKIAIENSGSMAEAALKLNRVFEAADAAAKQYLQNVKAKADAAAKAEEKAKAEKAEKAEPKASEAEAEPEDKPQPEKKAKKSKTK